MKIIKSKKSQSSDVPFDCKVLISKLKSCNEDELLNTLKQIKTWGCGKCELYHWIDILDIFDTILEDCCRKKNGEWILLVDLPESSKKKELLLSVISFTSLLIEHSFSRHLYNSIEHLITLLSSTDMQIVLAILNLLFVFSKRSNFFSRISTDKRQALLSRLCYLAENWGGKDYGFGLAECCQDLPLSSYPSSATTLNFEFYSNEKNNTKGPSSLVGIHIENVHLISTPLSHLMEEIVEKYQVPAESHTQLFTHLRLTKNFANYQNRLYCVQARLNALSIIVYCQSVALQEANTQLLYNGLIEELVDVLELKNRDLIEIKSASLKALTSIIHLDRNSKLKIIIDTTGASSYHGFLPILVRNCIHSLISGATEEFPLNFATSLFSFLYHLASYESGCEALVQCGIMESLLKVINWKGPELDHITFVTRAVRVIDLITNLEMSAFQNNNGLNIFAQRLENEVDICRTEQPFEIEVPVDLVNKEKNNLSEIEDIAEGEKAEESETPMEVENIGEVVGQLEKEPITIQIYPQRAALLKSICNWLKKAVQYSTLSEGIRHLIYGNFPRSIRHIISNAEYYGPSLFLLATDVVSVYVYHEPSLLSTLQDNGLTDVVLYALLVKDVPSTKEVLASLPNVFTALCLNRRGLEAFVELKPFERLFKIFLSPDYLQAMKRRRSESIGDTATSLGNAMDELMRHQPSLRSEAIKAIIKLLEEICKLGSDSKYVCAKTKSSDSSFGLVLTGTAERVIPTTSNISNESSSSEEEEDFDDDTATTTPLEGNVTSEIVPLPPVVAEENIASSSKQVNRNEQRQQIPLHDYIFNVMRFVDAILSNNSTDDHCQEFLRNSGLDPLFKILKLSNLPPDFPSSPACYNVASVFKSLLNLTHDKTIFSSCLEKLKEIIEKLDPLFTSIKSFEGSVLLEDLIQSCTSKKSSSSQYFVTPILQVMASVHAYIVMFVHICRTGQGEIRAISNEQWGSPLGIDIITQLSKIYISLVWESTLLLGLNDSNSQKFEFVKAQMDKLNSLLKCTNESENVASPMEVDSDIDPVCSSCGNRSENEKKGKYSSAVFSSKNNTQQKYIKPLLTVASKLGRSLAELFGLLVKLCVGSPIRRRSHHTATLLQAPSIQSQNISKHLNILLKNGLSWQPPFDTNIPKYRLTFYVCSIGFSSPMLFDDRKFPYHLMLKNFVVNGGQDSFFDCFKISIIQNDFLKSSEHPDGIIEFIDSWLLLLEKMANPQTLLDSPHSLPAKADARSTSNYVPFDPVKYLIGTHRKTFACILELWNDKLFKLNSESIINSMLTILSHLLKGESIIEKYLKDKETVATSSLKKPEAPAVIHAPDTSSSTEQQQVQPTRPTASASNPLAVLEDSSANPQLVDVLVDMGFTRELAVDALANAAYNVEQAAEWLLANSNLARSTASTTSTVTTEFDMTEEDQVIRAIAMSLDDNPKDPENTSAAKRRQPSSKREEAKSSEPLVNEEPLYKAELDSFTKNILSGTLKLLDQLPETVYKCCELLIAVAKRNGNAWFQEMVAELIRDISGNIINLIHSTSFIEDKKENSVNDWANQLSTLPEAHKLSFRIHLLALLFNEMKSGCAQEISNSDLFASVVELLERASYLLTLVYEKESKIITPKWLCPLILLIDVYEKYALASQRRKQLLANSNKRQWKFFDDRTSRWTSYVPPNNKFIDEAFRNGEQFYRFTAVRRRYTIQFNNMLQVNEETGNWRPIMFVNLKDSSAEETSLKEKVSNSNSTLTHIESLAARLAKSLIETMVSLVKLPIDPDTLHAVMRLCLRLTREYDNACLFAELGGISTLLNLTKDSQFVGIVSMTTLLIRHVVESRDVLKIAMEKIIRFQANSSLINNREMHYIFRYFNPAACRNIELFKDSAKSILRVNTFNKKLNEDDERTSTFLRAISLKMGENPDNTVELSKITRDVTYELLNCLPLKYAEDIKAPESEDKSGENKPKGRVFTSSSILLVVAELIRSYNGVAKIVCEHQYTRGFSDIITEDCSALSFVLDNLLYLSVTCPLLGDKDYPSFSKIFFAALASVTYTGDIHQMLVTEIKSSLSRTVLYPESTEKHLKIQALSTLITLVVESCPNSTFNPFHGRTGTTLGSNSTSVLKLMAKRGLITDLARVIQNLDLSSPNMPATVNSLLKTLEFLSKTLNYPHSMYTSTRSHQRSRTDAANVNSNSEQTVANEQNMEEESVLVDNSNVNNDNSNALNLGDAVAQPVTEDMTTNASSVTPLGSNADETAESDLFALDTSFDFNPHPRSGTFNSDDLRTDDDDDDVMHQHVVEGNSVNNRSELHDNTVNSNCAESESSDDSQTEDDDEDDEDVEEDEEEDDAAGSAQDEHEEDDEEEQMDDDDEEDVDDYLQDILDEGFRNYDSNLLFNMEDIIPSFLIRHNDRYTFAPFVNNDENSLNNDNSTQVVVSTPDVLVQHPLLSNNIEIAANASQFYSINQNNANSSQLNPRYSRSGRSRNFRTSVVNSSNPNWHMSTSRNNTSSVILHRLLGSNYLPQDIANGISSRGSNMLPGSLDIPDEDMYNSNSANGFTSAYSATMNQNSSLNAIPSTMCRWYEECRVLDGEYMYDAIFLVKDEILNSLNTYKDIDLKEKDKKKNDDVKISSLIKELKSHRDEVDRPIESNEEERIEDLHAHIEQLANSVINQVLEPPPTVSRQGPVTRRSHTNAHAFANLNNLTISTSEVTPAGVDEHSAELDQIEMEVGASEEVAIIPMATDDAPPLEAVQSDFDNDDSSSRTAVSSQVNNENALDELMDQSPNESGEQGILSGESTVDETVTSQSNTQATYNLTPEERAILGDQEIPEGVDPSFLAALPENIRQEVIAEQFRLQRLNNMQQQQQQEQQQQTSNANPGANSSSNPASFAEVNPEFLAALPPSIQEEVLAQQRAEQQRVAAQNSNPEVPVDPDSFFRSLPPSLRRQVLSDLDDSQIRLLSVDIANEARSLRQENEVRQRQFQERLFSSSTALSRIIRSATSARARYAIGLPNQWSLNHYSSSGNRLTGNGHSNNNRNTFSNARFPRNSLLHRSVKGKHLLDFDSLSSLLILLFIHDNLLHSQRLHRLIRNLCFHAPTRQWVIQSLLDILERTKESVDRNGDFTANSFIDSHSTEDVHSKFVVPNSSVSWLSISLESAFGSKTNVFYVHNLNKSQSSNWKKSNFSVLIHPQASSFVIINVLDILIFLSKTFPDQFTSTNSLSKNISSSSLNPSIPKSESPEVSAISSSKNVPNFFDVLMRHDSIHAIKKKTSKHGLGSLNPTQHIESDATRKADQSPFSQLLKLLSHQFIRKSSNLTDRLIRLLTHVTYAMVSDSEIQSQRPENPLGTEAKVQKYAELDKSLAHESLLKLIVDVLISKSCSEEGLVDATSLLIKLSTIFPNCRKIFYKLLLTGARLLGENVFTDISALSFEMTEFLSKMKKDNSGSEHFGEPSVSRLDQQKGTLQDRYSAMSIVVSSTPTVKHSLSGKEIQLPSMSNLISKTSSQFLFLRILKTILHIRELAIDKTKAPFPANGGTPGNDNKMDVDKEDKFGTDLQLDQLWDKLSDCLCLLSEAPDDHSVLVLQPAVEAFFLVHAPEKITSKPDTRVESITNQLAHINQSDSFSTESHLDGENVQVTTCSPETQKFLFFAEKHRVVLNQILRQSVVHLVNGPFAVLVDHTRILDFDVKRRYFRQELERLDHGVRRDDLAVHIRRDNVFENSFETLFRKSPEEWKNRFYIVFEGEEGQDAGGLLREFFTIISREIFNPNYALFTTSPGDRVTYMINQSSYCNTNHLSYFKFVGRLIGKAIFDNKLLDCYFTRSFYKHILGKVVKYTDLEAQDNALYQGLLYLLEHNVADMGTEMRFVYEVDDFGVVKTIELVPDGRNIIVTEANKQDYVKLMCQAKMTNSIKQQLSAFLEGFYALVPKKLIGIFNEHELELLISGLPNIDIDDLKNNTEYHKYQSHSLQIQWFWRALRTFDQADLAKFLQFITGTSKVPLQGFSALEGMNGPQKFQIHLDDRSTDRLPSAHTCFNQLDLPAYETYDKLKLSLLKAIHETESFGFA